VVSDLDGQVLTWATGGTSGFKGAREATPYAAQITSENAVSKAKTLHNVERAYVYVKGIGAGREQAVRGIVNAGVDLVAIYDVTPVPHNGCRKPKARKL
jgi:small subunit ribosomal protein S11